MAAVLGDAATATRLASRPGAPIAPGYFGAKAEPHQAPAASAYARKSAPPAHALRCRLGWGVPGAGR